MYGKGAIFPELFSNTPDVNRTIRIDTKLLAEDEERGRRRGVAPGGGDRGQAGAARHEVRPPRCRAGRMPEVSGVVKAPWMS
jgi:hypothetical protein